MKELILEHKQYLRFSALAGNSKYAKFLLEQQINEGIKQDAEELIKAYPNLKDQITQLPIKYVSWLITRFSKQAKVKEIHPIEDAIETLKKFSAKEQGISQKYKTDQDFSQRINSSFPNKKWSNPVDINSMDIDTLEKIIQLYSFKKQRFDIKDKPINADKVWAKGDWVAWMPHDRESSCQLGGIDPNTGEPLTTWCTARTTGSNLFYNYVARSGENIILYYIINNKFDPRSEPNSRLSIGFVNNEPVLEGQSGHVSVNAKNEGLTKASLDNILGRALANELLEVLSKHSAKLEGKHPSKKVIEQAALDLSVFKSITSGLGKEERLDLVKIILNQDKISPSVLAFLAKDENSDVRYSVARNTSAPSEVLAFLAKDKNSNVRDAAKATLAKRQR